MPKTVSISSLTFDLAESYPTGAMPVVARLSATLYRDGRSIDVTIPLNSTEMRSVYEQLQQIVLNVLEAESEPPHA